MSAQNSVDPSTYSAEVKRAGQSLGFEQVGIADIELQEDERYLERWLALDRHGEMHYMNRHGVKRSRPAELIPGTIRVVSARMNYLPAPIQQAQAELADSSQAYIARYALGRDYHKIMRKRLQQLADKIAAIAGGGAFRAFVDSAPVLEKALARDAGLGWIGKHTNLVSRDASSWFLLGEIYTDLPLAADQPASAHCGTCTACIPACPTDAIVAPYEVDARRCISYLTIELKGPIPMEFRKAIGNRVFGCDDCQLACPWNKFAQPSQEPQFQPRHGLDAAELTTLFKWSQAEWNARTEGSAIRRPGYEGWLRNIAVALGNAPTSPEVVCALHARSKHESPLVREHVRWALAQHQTGA